MERPRKFVLAREWIIFALCMGLGGHLVLAVILHTPDRWPWSDAGVYGLLVGLSVYIVVQMLRSVWRLVKGRAKSGSENGGKQSGAPMRLT